MARVDQLICDKCKKPIKKNDPREHKRLTRYDKDYHGTQIDLCAKCFTIFVFWLDSPGGPPPGYKFVKRPCPHNVPCADPNGCSGEELVPV